MCTDSKLYCKAIVLKSVWYWHKKTHRSMEQNKKPRNKPTYTWSVNLLQEVKNMKWRKKSFSLYFFLNKKETQF